MLIDKESRGVVLLKDAKFIFSRYIVWIPILTSILILEAIL